MSFGRLLTILVASLFALVLALTSRFVWADSMTRPSLAARAVDVRPMRSHGVVAKGLVTQPLEKRLLDDIKDHRLDDHGLLEAALIAGGVNHNDRLARYLKTFGIHLRSVQRIASTTETEQQLAEKIFTYVHRQIFVGGYRADCTDIARSLDYGDYNCVSGTILYVVLARSCGLACQGLESPAHVLARVRADGEWIDVEMTDPHWFDRQARRQSPKPRMSKGDEPACMRSRGRSLSKRQLVALVYYNRGVAQLATDHHVAAVAANLLALRFDSQNTTAQENLLAAWNNWALYQAERGDFRQAIDLLSRGRDASPDYDNFVENDLYVHKCWYESLALSGRSKAARDVLSQARRRHPSDSRIDSWQRAVNRRISANR